MSFSVDGPSITSAELEAAAGALGFTDVFMSKKLSEFFET